MHRNKDVTLGEDGCTNRSDHAPQNIFTLTSATLTLLKPSAKSRTRAIELVQDNCGKAVEIIAIDRKIKLLNRPEHLAMWNKYNVRMIPESSEKVRKHSETESDDEKLGLDATSS